MAGKTLGENRDCKADKTARVDSAFSRHRSFRPAIRSVICGFATPALAEDRQPTGSQLAWGEGFADGRVAVRQKIRL